MKKLHLALSANSKLMGVCGGIAETYDVDPTVVRLVTVFLGLVTAGTAVLVYIIAWFVLKEKTA